MTKENKKIVLISRKFDKNSGSGEWVYADYLKDYLRKKGFKVYAIEQKGVDIHSSRFLKMIYDFFILPAKLKFYRFFRGIKLFHFISENQAIWVPLIRLSGGKTIVTFHDIMRNDIKYFKKIKYNHAMVIYFKKFAYPIAIKSNIILCISSSTRNKLNEKLNVKIKKMHITNLGTNLSFKRVKKGRKIKIGFLGSLQERKRPLKIINLAKELDKNYEIEIWGKGKLKEKLQKKIKSKELTNINIKGFAPDNKLSEIYSSFDYFYFPSLYEGLGLPIIEAARCGAIPFILKDAEIPKEVRDFCFICKNEKEIARKIRYLERNKRKKENLIKSLIKKTKKFTWNNCFDKTIKIYNLA